MSEQTLERIESTLQELVVTVRDTNERVEKLDERVEALDRAVRENSERIEAETKRWDERFFQLARDNNAISRNVIVAAASVIIFGSVLRAVPDILEALALLSAAR
ncbi:hypothetical protein [Synechococcus sp. PCC 7336]|uniref:hypothetical protein n=1 Tax=Synechococcus sp. PCC 7336 TaxID=195250 RepID=UPI000344FDA3|nr:hypothetical protein [Synechococcus sp. PCC 7336]